MGLANKATFYPARATTGSTAIAAQSLTVTTSASGPTAYDTGSVSMVTLDVQGQPIRVRWDGTDPTSTVGHVLPAGTAYTWSASLFNAARFIRSSDSTGNSVVFASPVQD